MNIDNVDIITGGAGGAAANAADHVALALMGAGATVDFPSRPSQMTRSGQTLRGVHAVVRMAGGAGLAVSPGSSWGGGSLPTEPSRLPSAWCCCWCCAALRSGFILACGWTRPSRWL